jgi:hypothetical protein
MPLIRPICKCFYWNVFTLRSFLKPKNHLIMKNSSDFSFSIHNFVFNNSKYIESLKHFNKLYINILPPI